MINQTKRQRFLLTVAGLALGGVLGLAPPAQAQSTASRITRPSVLQGGDKTIKPAQPPALPGSKPAEDTVIPSDHAPADMAPNEALFDAINRGDLAAAKDALNRGADLESHNVLGQTPLELSVDIGRNDISFLLLSMRGSSPSHGGPPPPSPAAVAQAPVRPPPAARVARPAREVAAVAPQAPQLFAGNGGTPVPQAGFLGFGQSK